MLILSSDRLILSKKNKGFKRYCILISAEKVTQPFLLNLHTNRPENFVTLHTENYVPFAQTECVLDTMSNHILRNIKNL
jgi:hypothetical protein